MGDFESEPFSNVDSSDLLRIFAGRYLGFLKYATRYVRYAALSLLYIENFWDVPRALFGKGAAVKIRGGKSYSLFGSYAPRALYILLTTKQAGWPLAISDDFESVSFPFAGRKMALVGYDCAALAGEVFFGGEYDRLLVKGRDVLDIGAYIGDTAMLFSLRGAKKVVALEPFPSSYSRAKGNIEKNRLGRKITLLNAGAGAKDSEMLVESSAQSSGGNQLRGSQKGMKVPLLSLKGISKKYGLSDAVLKMDCEGAEYGILLGTERGTLRNFRQIMLEYHYGYVNIREKLKSAGFEVSIIKPPGYTYNNGWSKPHARTGILLAERRGAVDE